mgnify:CR=1 FL=1
MPALKPTSFFADISYLGRVTDREASLCSETLAEVFASFAGVSGEVHGGETRPSCSRVIRQHPRGTPIRNVRQFSAVSAEELAGIAATIDMDRLDPNLVGASLVVKGLPDFTHIPPSSRLQSEAGTTLVVDMENRPCHLPAKPIDGVCPGAGKGFKAAAKGRRGVTLWVEREGPLRVGDMLRLHIPDQPVWAHFEVARTD